jgi:hypothetical protein
MLKLLLLVMAPVLALPLATSPAASSAPGRLAASPVERFTATAVTHSPGGRAMGVNVEILIDRWSTPAERDRVIATLKSKGPGALLDLLRGLPDIGSISTPTSPGASLRFADARPAADGGRRIILATERPMSGDSGRKRVHRATDADYPFSVVDIRVDSKGNGEGTLAYAAKLVLHAKTGTIEVDNYAAELVQLTSVRPGGNP